MEKSAEKVYVIEITDDDHFHWWNLGRKQQADPYLTLNKLPQKQLGDQTAVLRHSEGSNYLYADTHVKWARLPSLWGVTRDTNAFWP